MFIVIIDNKSLLFLYINCVLVIFPFDSGALSVEEVSDGDGGKLHGRCAQAHAQLTAAITVFCR